MGSENAFNKKLTTETKLDKVEGLLEHLNLPPKAIDFIRAHHRAIQLAIAVVVIAVVVWSLYGSYRERITEEASTALSAALTAKSDEEADALRAMADKYSSTSSALWAKVEIAHLDMKNGSFADASKKYAALLAELQNSNPLYPLVLFGLAQSLEADKRYGQAYTQYDQLKNITGYERIGYIGMGRLEEAQGNPEKAIAIYNDFLLSLGDDPSSAQVKGEITAKISQLKARK